MRKFFVVLIFFLGVALIFFSFSELQRILDVLQQADYRLLLGALVLEICWLFALAMMYQALYQALGIQDSAGRLFRVVAAANFVNVVAPSAGLGGVAIFIRDGGRRGHASGRVLVSGALYVLFDLISVLAVVLLGLLVLVRRNNLNWSEILAATFLFLVAATLAFFLYIGSRSAQRLGDLLARIAHRINRLLWPILHRDYLSEQRAHAFAAEIEEGLVALRSNPLALRQPLFWALANKALLIFIFMCMFMAFKVPFSAGTIIGGFAIGYLFLIVSPTPSGVGVVEGVLAVVLHSLRVPFEAAVVVTLAYRAVTFWFPFFLGAWAFHNFNQQLNEIPLEK
jgi:hypothetical protein